MMRPNLGGWLSQIAHHAVGWLVACCCDAATPLKRRSLWCRDLSHTGWHLDKENATPSGQVPNAHISALRPNRFTGNGQPQAEAGPVLAAPVAERLKWISFRF